MRIYVNGVLENSMSASGSIPTNGYNLLIGTEQDSAGNFFNGVIDEVRLWSTALDSDQIKGKYASYSQRHGKRTYRLLAI